MKLLEGASSLGATPAGIWGPMTLTSEIDLSLVCCLGLSGLFRLRFGGDSEDEDEDPEESESESEDPLEEDEELCRLFLFFSPILE
jgi:hypothetical protein